MCISLQIGTSLSVTLVLPMGLYLRPVFFSALKDLQIVLPLKTVFKSNLREADVTFWWGTVLFFCTWGLIQFM